MPDLSYTQLLLPPRLIATIGLPFSGKSTLGSMLASALGADLIELDTMFGDATADANDRLWIERYRRAHARIRTDLADDRHVVFDAVNHRRHQRDRLRRIAARSGSGLRFVWIDIPADIARSRMRRNRLNLVRPDVPDDEFDKIARAFEPPDGEHDVLAYDGSIPVSRWVEDLADALTIDDDARSDGGLAFRRC